MGTIPTIRNSTSMSAIGDKCSDFLTQSWQPVRSNPIDNQTPQAGDETSDLYRTFVHSRHAEIVFLFPPHQGVEVMDQQGKFHPANRRDPCTTWGFVPEKIFQS